MSTGVDRCGEIDDGQRVRWEERLLREFDDLEQQAEGLHLAERDATVAELSVSEYAEVELASRLHASVGAPVTLALLGASSVDGVVERVGRDWLLVGQNQTETVVRMAAVTRARGLSTRAVPEEARSLLARLGLGSVLRQLAAERENLVLTLSDASQLRGVLWRVGADFVEVATESRHVEVVPFAALVTVRRG